MLVISTLFVVPSPQTLVPIVVPDLVSDLVPDLAPTLVPDQASDHFKVWDNKRDHL